MSNGTNYVVVGTSFGPQPSTYVYAGPTLAANPVPPNIIQSKICVGVPATTLSCTFNNPTQAGSLIIVGPTRWNPAATAPPAVGATSDNLGQGYTATKDYPPHSAFYKENSAAGVTTISTIASTGGTLVILEIGNVATVNSLDATSYQIGNIGPNNPITWEPISTQNPGDILIGYWSCPDNGTSTPTAAPGWALGGYIPGASNGWSAGWVWQNVNATGTYTPQVLTANCVNQQNAFGLAFKANLLSSASAPIFRPLVDSDLPARKWSQITDSAPNYLTQIGMNTGATIMFWNVGATGTNTDWGFGLELFDQSTVNPPCFTFPPEIEPSCRSLLSLNTDKSGIWPLEADSCASGNGSTCGGFHVASTNGDIVMQAGSSVAFPNSLVNVPVLGTDANGRMIASTSGGPGGGVNPAAQFSLPYYNTAGTGSTLAGAIGITVDSTQTVLNAQNGITTGTAPPTACGGNATGCLAMAETGSSTWGVPTPFVDILQADIATHKFLVSYNGSAFAPLGSGGPGGGIASINGDTTSAQTIVGTGSATVNTVSGTTTINVPASTAAPVPFGLITAVSQGTSGNSISGSCPVANCPAAVQLAPGGASAPQIGAAAFPLTSLSNTTPAQYVDQKFSLPSTLIGTYSIIAQVSFDTITSGTVNVSFQYVCVGPGSGTAPPYGPVQNFSVTIPAIAGQLATVAGTPTISGCTPNEVMFARTGITGTSATGNADIWTATLWVK